MKTSPFNAHAQRYDDWFEKHAAVYLSELNTVRECIPSDGKTMEVGAGSGRFALPLGIKDGIEPSQAMRKLAENRGLFFTEGVAENLPFPDAHFDCVLMVTTICFVNDPAKAIEEAQRVLKPQGTLVIGFVDRESDLGEQYEAHRSRSVFYKDATFFSVREITALLEKARLTNFMFRQTIFHPPAKITQEEPVRHGFGQGAFVVISARKDI